MTKDYGNAAWDDAKDLLKDKKQEFESFLTGDHAPPRRPCPQH